MDILKVCRVCLGMDITLYSFHSNSLEHYYQLLTGANPLHQLTQPMFACYECAALLRKFFLFRQKSLRAQAVLQGIVQRSGQITEEDVKEVKQYFVLSTSLKLARNVTDINIYPGTDGHDSKNKIKLKPTIIVGRKKYIINRNLTEESTVDDSTNSTINSEINPTIIASCSDINQYSPSPSQHQKVSVSTQIEEEVASPVVDDDTLHEMDDLNDKKTEAVCDKKLNRNKLPNDCEKMGDCVAFVNVEKDTKAKNESKARGREPKVKSCDSSVNMVKTFRKDTDLEEFVRIIHLTKEEQLEKIRLRQKSIEYVNATYKCDKCFLWFTDKRAQDKHSRLHDESRGSLACDVCRIRFRTSLQLKLHYSTHPKRYICRSCPRVFNTFYQARLHVLFHQGLRYKCPHCDEVYSSRGAYLLHFRRKHPGGFTCCFCGNSFGSQAGLNMHKSLVHKDDDESEISSSSGRLDCKQCGVRFAALGAYRRHLLTASQHYEGNDKFVCVECGERFPTRAKMAEHGRAAHRRPKRWRRAGVPKAERWPIECPHCSEEIKSSMENRLHYKRCHPDKKYPVKKKHICEVCGKTFVSKTVLSYHLNFHTRTTPFECGECGKAFHYRGGLTAHLRVVHSHTRPFVCDDCGRAFKAKGTLAKHIKIHTGERPYKCDVCEKAFAFNTTLKLHYRTVHLKLPDPYKMSRRQRKLAKALQEH